MKMKFATIAVAAIASCAVAATAFAADLPVKALPPVAPVWNWTGWYAGLNAGGIWSNSDGVSHNGVAGPCDPASGLGCVGGGAVPAGAASASLAAVSTFNANTGTAAGFAGGGQFGYNWQFNGRGVAGFEADLAW